MSILCPFAIGADLELVSEVLSSDSIKIDFIDAMEVLDSSPNEIIFATQNQGAYCGGGTPASAWKLILDPDTGIVISLEIKQSLTQIQNIRQSLFESSDGTLFTGGGWCGPKPPYYSTNGGDTWQPATHGVHPPNSTYSFVEFNGDVYAGTGYEPYHGQVYRWLGLGGANHWELVYDIAPPRSIVWTMSVYENQMFVGSLVYWWNHSGCEVSVPVYTSADGNTFNATTGIPPCYSVQDVLVVGDHLVTRAIYTPENYMYRWINDSEEWEEIAPYDLGYSWIRLVSHNGVIYAYGQAPSDTSKGIYQSADLGQTWEQISVLENPDVSSMTIHDDILYVATFTDANDTAYIYKLGLLTEIEVEIDIKPGSFPNSINLKSKGKVPVAILTTDDFDASDVNPDTVDFAGANPLRWIMEDVDNDGDHDMLLHFKTQELDLTKESTEATLEGETYDVIKIIGTDSVNIVPKGKGYGKKSKKGK
jgi:hypothetical protein